MPRYRVMIDQRYTWEAVVEADSEEEAERIVYDDVLNGFETNPDDADGVEFVSCQDGQVTVDSETDDEPTVKANSDG